MYDVEDAKIVCEKSSAGLEIKVRQYITGGYMPKSISQGSSEEKCVLLVKMKHEIGGTFDIEGRGTIGLEGSFTKKIKSK